MKLGRLVRELGGATPSKDEPDYWSGDIPWVSPKDMKVDEIWDSEDHVTARALAESSLTLVPPGSTLIVVRGMILAHTVPVGLNRVPVTLNQDMKALRPVAVDGRYLAWALRALQGRLLSLVEESGHGTKCLRSELWKSVEVPVPSPAVQRAIANFLDRKTADVDALIARKERMLALLAEKRTALVHRAVTKGLDPRVELKDSGVPWIGDIPAHWKVKRVKFAARLETGHTPSRSTPEYWNADECIIPWVSLNDTKTLAAQDYISEHAYPVPASSPRGARRARRDTVA